LDPNFAIAYARLGVAYSNLSQGALATDNLTRAFALRDRVSEREKLFISTQYYAFVTGQLEKANQELELWIREYPRDYQAHFDLGDNYALLGQYDKAIQETREALRLESNYVLIYGNLGLFYLALNRFDEAKAVFQEAQAHKLDDPYLRQNMYFLAFLQNDADAMREQLDWAQAKAGAEDLLLMDESETEASRGKLQRARELSAQAVESAKRNDAIDTAALWRANQAVWEAELGDPRRATAAATAALALQPGRDVKLLAALTLARAGDGVRASRLADELKRDFPTSTLLQLYWLPTIRAAVELNHGNAARALELLQPAGAYELGIAPQFQTGTLYPAYVRGLAYLRSRQAELAGAEMRKIVEHRGVVANIPLGSLAYLGLARAYAAARNPEKSRPAYADFLNLWKDADPGLKLLNEARAEYEKLQ
jgi:Tfp pilus assembly protein PilF